MVTLLSEHVHTDLPPLTNDIEVSVVMPCLNEALTVGRCIAKAEAALEQLGIVGEIVIADNGSSDGSQGIAREHGARVVHVERKGYGSALKAGIAAARGRFVIMGDADDSYDFTNLEPFIDRLRLGDDLVMGNRFRGGIKPGAMPWLHRYVGNPILTGILNLFFRTPIRDAHCGLRGFRKQSYERLHLSTSGMEFASEMVVKASLARQRISEVATTLSPDGRDRPPHLRSFRDGWRHLRFLLLMCPLWVFLIPALLLICGGLGLMVESVTHPDVGLAGVVMCVAGFQAAWLWAFARIHGWQSGLSPARPFTRPVWRKFTLERGALAGCALLIGGVGCTVALNQIDLGVFFMAVAAQTIFGSFFLGMLRMSQQDT